MDTGEGNLAMLSIRKYEELKEKQAKGLFKVNEIIEIHGSSFELTNITEDGRMELQLLSDAEVQSRNTINDLKNSFKLNK